MSEHRDRNSISYSMPEERYREIFKGGRMGNKAEKDLADAKQFRFEGSKVFTEERIERNYREGLKDKITFPGDEPVLIADLTKRELIALLNYLGKRYAGRK